MSKMFSVETAVELVDQYFHIYNITEYEKLMSKQQALYYLRRPERHTGEVEIFLNEDDSADYTRFGIGVRGGRHYDSEEALRSYGHNRSSNDALFCGFHLNGLDDFIAEDRMFSWTMADERRSKRPIRIECSISVGLVLDQLRMRCFVGISGGDPLGKGVTRFCLEIPEGPTEDMVVAYTRRDIPEELLIEFLAERGEFGKQWIMYGPGWQSDPRGIFQTSPVIGGRSNGW